MENAATTTAHAASAIGKARAAADLSSGFILACVEIAASPQRVFAALTSADVIQWWVRPGVFDTRTWDGDVQPGGRWRTSGVGPRGPYVLGGTYTEVKPPERLTHTWEDPERPNVVSTVAYCLERTEAGTRITLRHEGVRPELVCANTCAGWETSLAGLNEMLAAASE
jgi:uncharacterized protein YndB with AHSA1/START domain